MKILQNSVSTARVEISIPPGAVLDVPGIVADQLLSRPDFRKVDDSTEIVDVGSEAEQMRGELAAAEADRLFVDLLEALEGRHANLSGMKIDDLREIRSDVDAKGMKKGALVDAILEAETVDYFLEVAGAEDVAEGPGDETLEGDPSDELAETAPAE